MVFSGSMTPLDHPVFFFNVDSAGYSLGVMVFFLLLAPLLSAEFLCSIGFDCRGFLPSIDALYIDRRCVGFLRIDD